MKILHLIQMVFVCVAINIRNVLNLNGIMVKVMKKSLMI